jgi:hypothetical protein
MPLPVPVLPDVDDALDALDALDAPPPEPPAPPEPPVVVEELALVPEVVLSGPVQPGSHWEVVPLPPQPTNAATTMTEQREPRKTREVFRMLAS